MVVVVLYSIILHHALRKVIQLKRAARNNGAVAGNLRIHVGAKSTTPMPSHITAGNAAETTTRKPSTAANNRPGVGDAGALSDTEEPLQPKARGGRGIFKFLSR